MEIYQALFSRTNFFLIYSILIMHIMQMLHFATIPTAVCCIYYSMACIYVGASRSLNFYNVRKETESSGDLQNSENSLLSLKTAMSIPVIATLSLLTAYFAVINQLTFVNHVLNAYFMFISVLTIKKYLYAYS